jgi:hypothetical protein
MWMALAIATPGSVAWGVFLYMRYGWHHEGLPAAAGIPLLMILPVLVLGCLTGCFLAVFHCRRLAHRIVVAAWNASFPIWLTILLGPSFWLWPFSGGGEDGPPPPPPAAGEAPERGR